jgi:hypothetical protein
MQIAFFTSTSRVGIITPPQNPGNIKQILASASPKGKSYIEINAGIKVYCTEKRAMI